MRGPGSCIVLHFCLLLKNSTANPPLIDTFCHDGLAQKSCFREPPFRPGSASIIFFVYTCFSGFRHCTITTFPIFSPSVPTFDAHSVCSPILLCPTFSNFKIEWRHLSQVFLILRFPETNRTFRYIEAAKMSQKNRPLRLSGTAPHLLSQKN